MAEVFAGTAIETLARVLSAIRARYPTAEPEWVAEVVRAVLAALRWEATVADRDLLDEVEELGRIIANAKAEIAALGVDDIAVCDIPFATDELDAIVAHTATATNAILECCETLDAMTDDLDGADAARLRDATTRIYEACGFQDITGQRITKVVATLKAIERKVAQIVATFGARAPAGGPVPATPSDEAALLNGPQLPAAAMDQSDIDRLLASFD